ncbi:MAG: aldose epimerase family protein [Verrucomicrobiota bacterium]|jgi:aldose 1-epimerase
MKKTMKLVMLASAGLGAACFVGCTSMSNPTNQSGAISQAPFGKMPDGTPVEIYKLRNSNGMEARIMTYGGIVVSLKVPDKNGRLGDVVLGYDNLDGYLKNSPYFGALIGRYGNRIGGAKFTLGGRTYTLAVNDGPNSLHGGKKGFDKVVWKVMKADVGPIGPRLELVYFSKDGEGGYPGDLTVKATYTVMENNALRLDFTATTDKDTIANLTHHSYFNLAGHGDILGHMVYINANKFTPVDSGLIPTGELQLVDGTPFDFRTPKAIGARINQDDKQLKFAKGYDHNWVINKPMGKLALMARVTEPTTGRVLEVYSTDPGLQFYSGNFLDGTITGKGGWVYKHRNGFCMEPQHYPDSPNHPNFPSVELKPGKTYKNTIIYRFYAK